MNKNFMELEKRVMELEAKVAEDRIITGILLLVIIGLGVFWRLVY